MRVLLLVDILNDFCPGGALAVPEGDQTARIATQLAASGEFDEVIAVCEEHPKGHVSYASSHWEAEPYTEVTIGNKVQRVWPDHCEKGTFGAELHADIDRSLITKYFTKGGDKKVDSYSAFFDNDGIQTGLYKVLKELANQRGESEGEIELFVCGLATDWCVKFTVLDARKLGLSTTLIVDGCRAINLAEGDELRAFKEMRIAGADLIESRELLPDAKARAVSIEQHVNP